MTAHLACHGCTRSNHELRRAAWDKGWSWSHLRKTPGENEPDTSGALSDIRSEAKSEVKSEARSDARSDAQQGRADSKVFFWASQGFWGWSPQAPTMRRTSPSAARTGRTRPRGILASHGPRVLVVLQVGVPSLRATTKHPEVAA